MKRMSEQTTQMESCLVCGRALEKNEELHCKKCNEDLIQEVS